MAAVNKKLKFVILQQVNDLSLLLLQIFAAIENYPFSRVKTLHLNCPVGTSRVGKNVDYMEILELSSRVKISSRVS